MTYLENDLWDNEKITYKWKINNFYLFVMLFWNFIWFLLIISFLTNYWYKWILLLGLWIIIFFTYKTIYILTTEIFITNKRIFYKTWILARDIFELQLKQVESVILNQTFFQRIIWAWTLAVKWTWWDSKPIIELANPDKMKKHIYKEMQNLENNKF